MKEVKGFKDLLRGLTIARETVGTGLSHQRVVAVEADEALQIVSRALTETGQSTEQLRSEIGRRRGLIKGSPAWPRSHEPNDFNE